jgi:hypothetical protein
VFNLTALGPKEAEVRIIGCDLHARQQTIAMLDRDTGEVVEKTLEHKAETVRPSIPHYQDRPWWGSNPLDG